MKRLFIAILTFVATSATAADAYLCIPDKVTGFKIEGSQWKSFNYELETLKYLVRKPTETDIHQENPWVYGVFGNETFYGGCDDPIDEEGFIFCDTGITEDFRMNVNTLRFQLVSLIGYVITDSKDHILGGPMVDEGEPYIMIGKCSPL
jgi:hypothetical protein